MAIITLLATPKVNILQTPMAPRSHARIVKILKDGGEDEDSDEDSDEKVLKANFSRLGSESDDSDDIIQEDKDENPLKDEDGNPLKGSNFIHWQPESDDGIIPVTAMALRSRKQVVRILEDEKPLKAPNFKLGSDDFNDGRNSVMAAKFPVSLLQPAELEAGWSNSHIIQPTLNINPLTLTMEHPSMTGDIITTPVLDKYGVSFNTLYKLLICTSCAEGFPLKALHTHLRRDDNKRSNWDEGLKAWKLTRVVYENHCSGKIPPLKTFIKNIIDSLVLEGHITSEKDICAASNQSDWKSLALPKFIGEKRPQVLGLRVFYNAVKCTVKDDKKVMCGHIVLGSESMRQHIWLTHGKGHGNQKELTTAQTLTEDKSWMHYFEVSSDTPICQAVLHSTSMLTEPSAFDAAAARELLRKTTVNYTHDLHVVPDLNVKTILPTFIETGVDKFLRQFNRTTLQKNYDPEPDNAMYSTLRALVVDTYSNDIEQLKEGKLESHLLLYVTNCTPISKSSMRRSFFPLTEKKSIAAYALLECKFLWAMIQARKNGKDKVYTFNKKQGQALDHLRKTLGKLKDNNDDDNLHSTAKKALYTLFDEIYFPEEYKTKNTAFDMPSTTFLAIQCVTVDGAYLNIHLIPPIIAKLQYSFRLRAMHKVMYMRGDIPNDTLFYK